MNMRGKNSNSSTFGATPRRGAVSGWPILGGLEPGQQSLVESSQNWLFVGGTWSQCHNHMESFLKLEGVTGYEDAFSKAGYQKQIEMKRGTWKLVEGTFTLWVNTYNEVLPVYAIVVNGENGPIGVAYVAAFPDLLQALEQFRGMLSLFEGIATKQAKVD